MYAIHTTIDTANTAMIRNYDQDMVNSLSSSSKKAWENVQISVSKNNYKTMKINSRISLDMMKAQEVAVKKIWDTPENDVWDDLYKELNA
jgi:hypothetical protein